MFNIGLFIELSVVPPSLRKNVWLKTNAIETVQNYKNLFQRSESSSQNFREPAFIYSKQSPRSVKSSDLAMSKVRVSSRHS